MAHYRITNDLRRDVNDYLGMEYIKPYEVGHELAHLDHYEQVAHLSPEKAKLLMAALFPEEVSEPGYLSAHKEEIARLSDKLHPEPAPARPKESWGSFLIIKEWTDVEPRSAEFGFMRGNIVRFD